MPRDCLLDGYLFFPSPWIHAETEFAGSNDLAEDVWKTLPATPTISDVPIQRWEGLKYYAFDVVGKLSNTVVNDSSLNIEWWPFSLRQVCLKHVIDDFNDSILVDNFVNPVLNQLPMYDINGTNHLRIKSLFKCRGAEGIVIKKCSTATKWIDRSIPSTTKYKRSPTAESRTRDWLHYDFFLTARATVKSFDLAWLQYHGGVKNLIVTMVDTNTDVVMKFANPRTLKNLAIGDDAIVKYKKAYDNSDMNHFLIWTSSALPDGNARSIADVEATIYPQLVLLSDPLPRPAASLPIPASSSCSTQASSIKPKKRKVQWSIEFGTVRSIEMKGTSVSNIIVNTNHSNTDVSIEMVESRALATLHVGQSVMVSCGPNFAFPRLSLHSKRDSNDPVHYVLLENNVDFTDAMPMEDTIGN